MVEIVDNQRRNEIRTYWVQKSAQWKNEGSTKVAGRVDDFVRVVNKPGDLLYSELQQAVRELHR